MRPQYNPIKYQAQARIEKGIAKMNPIANTMIASMTKARNRRNQCSCKAGL